jgi:hypothetical protein
MTKRRFAMTMLTASIANFDEDNFGYELLESGNFMFPYGISGCRLILKDPYTGLIGRVSYEVFDYEDGYDLVPPKYKIWQSIIWSRE